MIIIQIMIGLFVAVGVGMILADVFRIPTFKASKAAHNLGKKGEKRVSIISIYQKEIAGKLAGKLRLNEYKRAQLEADLKTAAMDVTPEEYTANAIVKAATIGIFAIPAFFISKIVGMLILGLAVYIYVQQSKYVSRRIRYKREKIEYELPRLVGSIDKQLKHSRDVVNILDSYKETAGPELKQELETTVADMRSGNHEVALTRLESRVGSSMMSDVTRGLITVVNGDVNPVYWGTLALKFSDIQRQHLKQQANAVPRKVKKLSMALLVCFILIYISVLGQVLMSSMATFF